MMKTINWKERVYCGDMGQEHVGRTVHLMGWVDAIRDHGNLLFIHLRDRSGIVQVVFDPNVNQGCSKEAESLKEEWVISLMGDVASRTEGTENPNLATGSIEVFASTMTVLSRSKVLPFQISEKAMVFGEDVKASPEKVEEELRLQYRYLDLRRPSIRNNFLKRYEIIKTIRDYLDQLHFVEVETPVLTKSTPEGARDYLVPSRIHKGKFYALPQSPQLFKQILMMSGMDRYYQVVKCFRDEDLRPNRQPEFTQLDLEASFIDEEFIYEIIEELTVRMFAAGGITLPRPFPKLTYQEAVEKYGTDRPDLRFGMTLENVTDIFQDTDYTIFRQIVREGGIVKGFCVKGQAQTLSKNVLQNEYALKIVPAFGAKGMSWMKVTDGSLQSNIVQFFNHKEQEQIISRFQADDGDVVMLIADVESALVNDVLCRLRLHVANRLGLIPQDLYCPLWVTNFPLFELKDGALSSQHHPFTMPNRTDFDPTDHESLIEIQSRAYDLVVNGEELGGGSIRIHDMETQRKIFEALGLGEEELEAKFGFFLRALEYGAPPHGGLALGLDRVVAMILNVSSIRDVIAFPKNRSALCPLTRAPSEAGTHQLEELGIDEEPFDLDEKPSLYAVPPHAVRLRKKIIVGPKINEGEVQHVAKLARLKLSDDEKRSFQKDLSDILGYVETLETLNTEDVPPMSHVLKINNVWRKDSPVPREDKSSKMLSNAPESEGAFYKVPKILEG
jgi:aspartyl-tRNA synthetase